jgi:hypothetical protein
MAQVQVTIMIKALALVTAFTLIIYFSATIANYAIAAESTATNGWRVSFSLGKSSHSNPPKPDQIFKIYYRAINGTVDDVDTSPLKVVANITSSDSNGGLLEVKYPRNYPYTNDPKSTSAGADNFIIYAQQAGNREEQILANGTTTTDCFFIFSIPFKEKTRITLTSSLIPEENFGFHGDNVPENCVSETIAEQSNISPLAQVKAGVLTKDVVCKDGFERILHPNGKPYCASSKTITILKDRWHIT